VIDLQIRPSLRLASEEARVVQRAARASLRAAGRTPDAYSLTIVITDDEEIAHLNERFRGQRAPTDVLSFDNRLDLPNPVGDAAGYLGDVVISLPRAREQAAEAGHDLESELALLTAHGVLHLLGYDHLTEADEHVMWELQEEAAAEAVGGQGSS